MTTEQTFIELIQQGKLESVSDALAQKPGLVNAKSAGGTSAVLMATYYGHAAIARLLIERGAALDVFDASATNQLEVLRKELEKHPELVNACAGDGFYPLGLACFFGSAEAAALLLGMGADVNQRARNAQKVQPIHAACAGNHPAIAKMLLERGADPNARQEGGFAPLHAAAQNGSLPIIHLLLQYGAGKTAKTDAGKTALDFAREGKHHDVISELE